MTLDQLLVLFGKLASDFCRGQRLLVSADGDGKVRRIHFRQRLAFLDLISERHQQTRRRAGHRGQDGGGLVIVEVNGAGRIHRLVELGKRHGGEMDVLLLGRGQGDIAGRDDGGLRGAVRLGAG